MLEELLYFDRAEDYRKFVWNTASRERAFRPGRLQSDVLEEFRGHYEVVDRLGEYWRSLIIYSWYSRISSRLRCSGLV